MKSNIKVDNNTERSLTNSQFFIDNKKSFNYLDELNVIEEENNNNNINKLNLN